MSSSLKQTNAYDQMNIDQKITLRQVEMLYANNIYGLISTIFFGAVICFSLLNIVQDEYIFAWGSALILIVIYRIFLARLFHKQPRPYADIHLWRRYFALGSTCTGLLWGIAGIVLFPEESLPHQLILGFIIIGMTATAVAYLSSVPYIYISYMILSLAPLAISLSFKGSAYIILTVLAIPFILFLARTSLALSKTMATSLRLGFENEALASRLAIEKETAEISNRAKTSFLSRMSHELRTPLNAIIGFTKLVQVTLTNKENKDSLQEVINAGDHLLELINELLDLSRIESGKLELNKEVFSLTTAVNSSLDLIRHDASKKDINIVNRIDPDSDIILNQDILRFKQILINLLSNAVKYNKDNGTIILDCDTDNDMLTVSISDSGIGLSEEECQTIFTPFQRGNYDNTNTQGTGIGLSIAKELIHLMDGQIGVRSTPGEGSTFWINLPYKPDSPQ